MEKLITRVVKKANRWGLFDGARITRQLPKRARGDAREFAGEALEEGALLLPVGQGNQVFTSRARTAPASIAWLTKGQFEDAFQLQYNSESLSFTSGSGPKGAPFELIYLGEEQTDSKKKLFAVDLSAAEVKVGEHHSFEELRSFMKSRSDLLGTEEAVSISRAGYALALRNWAGGVKFCPACGGATRSVAIGTRKECTACGKKQYVDAQVHSPTLTPPTHTLSFFGE